MSINFFDQDPNSSLTAISEGRLNFQRSGQEDEMFNTLVNNYSTVLEVADLQGVATKEDLRPEEEKMECTELQKKLHASEDMVQSLKQELCFSKCTIQLLRDDLHRSEDNAESLKKELEEKGERNCVLIQRLQNAQESTRFIQNDLNTFKRRSSVLQKRLNAAEEQNRALQEVLRACKAQVQEAERDKQCKFEYKEEPSKKTKNMSDLMKGLKNRLNIILDKLQWEMKMSLERKESLKRTIENVKAKNMAEIEELQHSLDKAKEEAREMERKLSVETFRRKLLCSFQHSTPSLKDDLYQSGDSVQPLKENEETNHPLKPNMLNIQESTKFMQKDLDVSEDLHHKLQQQLSTTNQNSTLRGMASEVQVRETEGENPSKVMSSKGGIEKIKND